MGLGPPVCLKCEVIAELAQQTWYCPVCHTEDLRKNMWALTPKYQQQLEANSKFYKFMRGDNVNNN